MLSSPKKLPAVPSFPTFRHRPRSSRACNLNAPETTHGQTESQPRKPSEARSPEPRAEPTPGTPEPVREPPEIIPGTPTDSTNGKRQRPHHLKQLGRHSLRTDIDNRRSCDRKHRQRQEATNF